MTRRMLAAIAATAALISATALSLPVTSQGATSGCPTPTASAPTKAAIPQELLALKQKEKQYLKLKASGFRFTPSLKGTPTIWPLTTSRNSTSNPGKPGATSRWTRPPRPASGQAKPTKFSK
jgi:hypothetical protein